MRRKPTSAELFTQRCAPYAPMVYRHCLHMLKNPQEAEDAAQESMLRAFRAFDSLSGNGVATWLFRIAHNTCLDVLKSARMRRQRPMPENWEETADPALNPEQQYLQNAQSDALWQAVSKLKEDQQVLLHLFYGQQMGYEEMAKATGVSTGTVKSRLSRARDALRKVLEAEESKNG
ncbi:MAG: RNA polymerase sigma factor [Clostridiales bacterium]|nr:RNA polymerase sigma factor [Clostridiales bacterium]